MMHVFMKVVLKRCFFDMGFTTGSQLLHNERSCCAVFVNEQKGKQGQHKIDKNMVYSFLLRTVRSQQSQNVAQNAVLFLQVAI